MFFDTVLLQLLSPAILFFGIILVCYLTYKISHASLVRDPNKIQKSLGSIEGALFALLGLLVAFTFSGGWSRLDVRRTLIVEEVNAISTSYLRLDLLRDDDKVPLQKLFHNYIESRIRFNQSLRNREVAFNELEIGNQLQKNIWEKATLAVNQEQNTLTGMLLLPSLNQMFDVGLARTVAAQIHTPFLINLSLFVIALICAALSGYGMSSHKNFNWRYILMFALTVSFMIYVIVDLDFLSYGLIRLDIGVDLLKELQSASLHPLSLKG